MEVKNKIETNILSYESIEKQINELTFTDYFNHLMLMAKSVFKWNNLPNGIDEKWIEKYLFAEGNCLFFKDPIKGLMVAKCTTAGNLNYYDEPTQLKPYGTGYTGPTLENNKDCVLIRNNDEMLPTSPTIQLYAWRLTNTARTIDTNIDAMKTPVLIKCTEKQKMSLMQAYKQWDGFKPVIFADKTLELEKFQTMKTDAPVVFDKLQLHKHAIWNEIMTRLGINNANQDKKERLVDDEVQANNEQIQISAEVMLKSRQRACEQINEIFKTNISVEIRKSENANMSDSEGTQKDANDSKGSESNGRGEE